MESDAKEEALDEASILAVLDSLPVELQVEIARLTLLIATTYLADGKAVIITHAKGILAMRGINVSEDDAAILVSAVNRSLRERINVQEEVRH